MKDESLKPVHRSTLVIKEELSCPSQRFTFYDKHKTIQKAADSMSALE